MGLHADDPAGAGQAQRDGGHRLPRAGSADDVYYLEKDDLYLVGTSEVPLAAYHSDEILEAESLPRRYAAFSPCYRREAGSYGKDTRGIFRVHWFDKVEMFVYTTLEESYAEHQRILGWEKAWLDALELPYRVIDVASGDLGLSAIRKFDCEAWIPTQGKYREVSSASNTTEFQTRRLDIRVRGDEGTTPAATLNGTLCAMTRTIIALLENGQQEDGSVRLPAALHPLLGEVLRPICRDLAASADRAGRRRHARRRRQRHDRGRTLRGPRRAGRRHRDRHRHRPRRARSHGRRRQPAVHRGLRRREQRRGDVPLRPRGRAAGRRHVRRQRGGAPGARAHARGSGRGRGGRRRLPAQQAVPRQRDHRPVRRRGRRVADRRAGRPRRDPVGGAHAATSSPRSSRISA